ncbi:MAG: hypothetical protein Q9227_008692 [Pyrenula ochraceoflavens]
MRSSLVGLKRSVTDTQARKGYSFSEGYPYTYSVQPPNIDRYRFTPTLGLNGTNLAPAATGSGQNLPIDLDALERMAPVKENGSKEKLAFKSKAGFRERIRHFTWAWYTLTMSTGGMATLIASQPHSNMAVYVLGHVVYLFNAVCFVVITTLMLLRFILHQGLLTASIKHEREGFFFPTLLLSIATFITGAQKYTLLVAEGRTRDALHTLLGPPHPAHVLLASLARTQTRVVHRSGPAQLHGLGLHWHGKVAAERLEFRSPYPRGSDNGCAYPAHHGDVCSVVCLGAGCVLDVHCNYRRRVFSAETLPSWLVGYGVSEYWIHAGNDSDRDSASERGYSVGGECVEYNNGVAVGDGVHVQYEGSVEGKNLLGRDG